ncbi:MAG: A/G-specific adenine glycosylase [Bacteroidetes bacterium]|nr:A/G-specific adenine glycosylase [Bacteroidota bacterium]
MNFSKIISQWYEKNKRDLPWRKTKDAYKIWLSEIILQQTRVAQGLPYYREFVKKFPTVRHLAQAKEDLVLKTWQGLGYYSRARNLHATAKFISKNLKGKFPAEFEEIKKLKGVGEYTASAIASFAFNKPYAVVDGNVFRVLSRVFGIKIPIDSAEGKKVFLEKANSLLDKKNPGLFNQAIMEFGALQCVPQNPDCKICPLKKNCVAFKKNLVGVLPVKSKKIKIRERFFNYFIVRDKEKILIRKRTGNDIWKNLYDFPMIETNKEIKNGRMDGWKSGNLKCTASMRHILSHQVIFAKFWEIDSNSFSQPPDSFYINESQANNFAFPRLIEKYFDEKLLNKR